MLWISLTFAVSFALFYNTEIIGTALMKKVCKGIIILIGKYADLSEEYGGEFTISIPRTPLFNYSIMLKDNEYSFLIQGIRVVNGTGEQSFISVTLEAGGTYSIRMRGSRIFLTKR